MASVGHRNLTRVFSELRDRVKVARSLDLSSPRGYAGSRPLLDIDSIELQVQSVKLLPPWVDLVESTKLDIQRIDIALENLRKLHTDRLRVFFGEDSEQEQRIEQQSLEIAEHIKKCEVRVKLIASKGVSKGEQLSFQERSMRLSAMKAMALKLNRVSRKFRTLQQDFIRKCEAQGQSGKDFFVEEVKESLVDCEVVTLDQLDVSKLAELKEDVQVRSKEITKVAASVHELAQVFKELSILVVEQGSILNRIDHNIESSLKQIKKGKVELKKAEEYQKGSRSLMIIVLFLIGIAILIAILVERHT